MRAFEITLFLMLIPVSLGLLNAMGIFSNDVRYDIDNSNYLDKTVTNLQKFQMPENANIIDYAIFTVTMAFFFIIWAIKIVLSIIWIYPMLEHIFGIPTELSVVLQVGLWVIWVVGVIQIKHAVSLDGLR